jgi:hypothetical protein
LALLVVAALIFGLVKLLGGDDSSNAPPKVGPIALSEAKLADEASAVGHPVYWLGTVPGTETYEFTATEDGRVYVRYLTQGAKAGDPHPNFLTVGTYSIPDAKDALQRASDTGGGQVQQEQGYSLLGGPTRTSTYVVFDDQPDLQIEIYDPRPGKSLKLAKSGTLQPVD